MDPEENTGISAEEAGNAFSKLLDPQAGDTDEGRAHQADEEEEDLDPDPEEEEEEEELDPDADPDDEKEPADSEASAPRKVTIKVDGEDREVTEKELIDSYQITSAARQRLTAAAEKEKSASALVDGLTAFQQRANAALEALEARIKVEDAETNWDELRVNDPAEWSARMHERDQLTKQAADVKAKADTAASAAKAKADADAAAHLDEQVSLLKAAVPAWKDPKAFDKDYAALGAFASETYGVKPEEFGSISDHRVLLALRDASLYRASKAKAEGAVDKAKGKAKPTPTLQPGPSSATGSGGKPSGLARAEKRLQRSGSTKDAARAFTHLL